MTHGPSSVRISDSWLASQSAWAHHDKGPLLGSLNSAFEIITKFADRVLWVFHARDVDFGPCTGWFEWKPWRVSPGRSS